MSNLQIIILVAGILTLIIYTINFFKDKKQVIAESEKILREHGLKCNTYEAAEKVLFTEYAIKTIIGTIIFIALFLIFSN